MMKTILLVAIAVAASATAEARPARPPQAKIPFANSAIDDWQADGDRALYIRANGKWYHGETLGLCRDLTIANTIGFDTGGGVGDLDSFSTLVVGRQRCPLTSLVKSGPPPRKSKAKAK